MQRAFDASGASDSNEGLGKLENCGGGGGGGWRVYGMPAQRS